MSVEVILPQWGMGMTDGTVLRWMKAEGDDVEEDEELVEVETSKATDFVYAPATGVLSKILVPAGETADVLAVLGMIEPS